MSTLIEVKSEEDWDKYSASLPPTTLQIIYFKAEWAAPVSISSDLWQLTGRIPRHSELFCRVSQ
jgi:hypothetical protein